MLRGNFPDYVRLISVDDLFSMEFRAEPVFFKLLTTLSSGEDGYFVSILRQDVNQQTSDNAGTADQYFHCDTSD